MKLKHLFFKTQLFKRNATALNAWEDIDALKCILDEHPDRGDVIPGSEGLRKVRIGLQSRGQGKRGGGRVIYYFASGRRYFLLVAVYAKTDKADLTQNEIDELISIRDATVVQIQERFYGKELS